MGQDPIEDDVAPVTPGSASDAETTAVTEGPAFAVLAALEGARLPAAPLGIKSVPPQALAIPTTLLTDALIAHAKKCRRARCPGVPAALWQYKQWREKAIRGQADQIYRVLWTDSQHDMVREVRSRIRAAHPELAGAIADGSLARGTRLHRMLTEGPARGVDTVLAALWASEFKEASSSDLFRVLVPLALRNAYPVGAVTTTNSSQSKNRERQLRSLRHEKKVAEQRADSAREGQLASERALARAMAELDETRGHLDRVNAEISDLRNGIRETDVVSEIRRRDSEKASKANTALREDLRAAREKLTMLEVSRSELARHLAYERRWFEQFKLEHKTGAEAVWEYIEKEGERIDIDRIILSGGARERAEQEWTLHRKHREAFLNARPDFRAPPPPKLVPKAHLQFRALGGGGEVGRSCYLVEIGKHRILVDCGIKPGRSDDLRPYLDGIDRPDALIVTHAHTDHIGWIPALLNRFGDIDIYCSDATAGLMPIMLDDAHRHYVRKLTAAREKARFVRNATEVVEEYETGDVAQVPNLVIDCPFDSEIGLPFGGLKMRFFKAGHILGAASILLEDRSGRRIFFSGDFASFPQLTVPAAAWPNDIGSVDLLVLESTYGDRNHGSLEASREQLVNLVRETTEQRGGSIILSSFALGRAQELIALLGEARRSGILDRSTPVHIDGMIRQINPVYKRLAAGFDLNGFMDVSGEAERREVLFEAQQRPAIIVTTSGMMMGGPVIEYARQLLPDQRNRIVFSGYQDEGAPSKELLDLTRHGTGKRVIELKDEVGEPVVIEAAVPAKHVGLSAHADQAGLLEYAQKMQPASIALVHGDSKAQEVLRTLLRAKDPDIDVVCAPIELDVP